MSASIGHTNSEFLDLLCLSPDFSRGPRFSVTNDCIGAGFTVKDWEKVLGKLTGVVKGIAPGNPCWPNIFVTQKEEAIKVFIAFELTWIIPN